MHHITEQKCSELNINYKDFCPHHLFKCPNIINIGFYRQQDCSCFCNPREDRFCGSSSSAMQKGYHRSFMWCINITTWIPIQFYHILWKLAHTQQVCINHTAQIITSEFYTHSICISIYETDCTTQATSLLSPQA